MVAIHTDKGKFILALEDLLNQYKDVFRDKTSKRKTLLLTQGECAQRIFFITDGVMRLFHNNDGKEITLQFFTEGQCVSSFESFYQKQPGKFSIETVTDCQYYYLTRNDFENILRQTPSVKDEFFDYLCGRFVEYTNLFLSRIQYSPEERYLELQRHHSELMERVPQHELASYLGISEVSLSRIKTRVKKNCGN